MKKSVSETIIYESQIRDKQEYRNAVILKASVTNKIITIEPLAFHQLDNVTLDEIRRIANFLCDLYDELSK